VFDIIGKRLLVKYGLVTVLWFFPGTPVSSSNKTDRHDITGLLLKMALNATTVTLLNMIPIKII